jgi:hypothetical protein
MAAAHTLAVIDNLLSETLPQKMSSVFFDVRSMKTAAT